MISKYRICSEYLLRGSVKSGSAENVQELKLWKILVWYSQDFLLPCITTKVNFIINLIFRFELCSFKSKVCNIISFNICCLSFFSLIPIFRPSPASAYCRARFRVSGPSPKPVPGSARRPANEIRFFQWTGPANERWLFQRAGLANVRWFFQRARPGRQKRNEFSNCRAGLQKRWLILCFSQGRQKKRRCSQTAG